MEDLNALFASRVVGAQSSIVRELLAFSKMPHIISLAGGIPAADMFDLEGIEAATLEAMKMGVSAYQYSVTDGEPELRERVTHLIAERGIESDKDQVVITSGSQQGLDLVARTFIDAGDVVLVEQPTYLAAIQVFRMAGAEVASIKGSTEGLDLDDLETQVKALKAQNKRVKALYIVPTFANPTGSTMSEANRVRLLSLAVEYNFVILEDDPYGEIRFEGDRVPSIYGLAKRTATGEDHVVYLSSFSKILVPGLRLGFIVANKAIREKIVLVKQSVDLHTPVLPQLIVEKYLASGRLKDRIPAISYTYGQRCASLMKALDEYAGEDLEYQKPVGGMFLWARLKNGMSATKLLNYAKDAGVVFVPGAAFYAEGADDSTLRLSFATVNPEGTIEAAKRLAVAIQKYKESN